MAFNETSLNFFMARKIRAMAKKVGIDVAGKRKPEVINLLLQKQAIGLDLTVLFVWVCSPKPRRRITFECFPETCESSRDARCRNETDDDLDAVKEFFSFVDLFPDLVPDLVQEDLCSNCMVSQSVSLVIESWLTSQELTSCSQSWSLILLWEARD